MTLDAGRECRQATNLQSSSEMRKKEISSEQFLSCRRPFRRTLLIVSTLKSLGYTISVEARANLALFT